jgi:hypothetical protein
MATSSKHDHKNVGCHRINPPPRSGDRVLATTRTPAEIYKHRKETFARKDERDALKAAPMMFSARSEARKAAISPMSFGVWKRVVARPPSKDGSEIESTEQRRVRSAAKERSTPD